MGKCLNKKVLSIIFIIYSNILFSQDLKNKQAKFYFVLGRYETIINKFNFNSYYDVKLKIKNINGFCFDSIFVEINDIILHQKPTDIKVNSLFAKIKMHRKFYFDKTIYLWDNHVIEINGKRYIYNTDFIKKLNCFVEKL